MNESLLLDNNRLPGGPGENSMVTTPSGAVEQTNEVDRQLLTAFASGPSSLIDQEVLGALNQLKEKQHRPAVWQLILNPIAAYKTLQAFWGETDAKANARRAIATSVLTQVKWGEEDLQRDTVLNYMKALKTSLGYMLPEFCEQHGIAIPRENSINEMLQLLRLNHAIVSVAKYQKELAKSMEQVIAERTTTEAALAISHSRSQMLPRLIQSQEQSLPLKRKLVFQNTAHTASLVGGVPVAAATGFASGVVGGLIIGLAEGISWTGKQLGKVTARFTSSRAR